MASYAEIMPRSDYKNLRVVRETEGTWRTGWELFADFLEKGVICRARLYGVFLPRANDRELAVAYFDAITKRPLPLTT
jgi:hypothetical protein